MSERCVHVSTVSVHLTEHSRLCGPGSRPDKHRHAPPHFRLKSMLAWRCSRHQGGHQCTTGHHRVGVHHGYTWIPHMPACIAECPRYLTCPVCARRQHDFRCDVDSIPEPSSIPRWRDGGLLRFRFAQFPAGFGQHGPSSSRSRWCSAPPCARGAAAWRVRPAPTAPGVGGAHCVRRRRRCVRAASCLRVQSAASQAWRCSGCRAPARGGAAAPTACLVTGVAPSGARAERCASGAKRRGGDRRRRIRRGDLHT